MIRLVLPLAGLLAVNAFADAFTDQLRSIWAVAQHARILRPQSRMPLALSHDPIEEHNTEVIDQALPAVVMLRGQHGLGTGFFVNADGLIVTNAHVAALADADGSLLAQLAESDKPMLQCKVMGSKPSKDLALVQVLRNSEKRPFLSFGNPKALKRGHRVIALGSPLGVKDSVSMGIVSNLNQKIEGYPWEGMTLKGLIQTDAAINPGNSGGPLIDSHGKVMGVNSVILSRSGGSQGLGFAIPITEVQALLDEFAATGKIEPGPQPPTPAAKAE